MKSENGKLFQTENPLLFLLPGHLNTSDLDSQISVSLKIASGVPATKNVPGALPEILHRISKREAIDCIIYDLSSNEGIEVDPKRVREAVEDLASTYEDSQQAIDYFYADQERLAPVESLTLENQVVDWVLDQVTVEDEPTTFEALSTPAAIE